MSWHIFMLFITLSSKVFMNAIQTVLNYFCSNTIITTMVSKHLLLLVNQLSHSRGNITHRKKGVRGSPLFPTSSTQPGDFNPIELFLRPYFLFLMWLQPSLFDQTYLFIPSLFLFVLVLIAAYLRPTTL